MSKILFKNDLEGTCYFEIAKGKYKGKHWNEESIYFTEADFMAYELILDKYVPKYDHFGFVTIDKEQAAVFINKLNEYTNRLVDKSFIEILKDMDLYSMINSNRFEEDLIAQTADTEEFIYTTKMLIDQLEKFLKEKGCFSILGI